MSKAGVAKQRRYRARKRARRAKQDEYAKAASTWLDDLPDPVAAALARDMKFTVTPTPTGTWRVDWDMSKDSDEFLRALAEVKGLDFDAEMEAMSQDVLYRILKTQRARARRN